MLIISCSGHALIGHSISISFLKTTPDGVVPFTS
jgi:hypothetical protein